MKALFGLGSLVLALIPAAAMAQQPAVCERVVFSEEVLARFPNIRAACLDVISRDGHGSAGDVPERSFREGRFGARFPFLE